MKRVCSLDYLYKETFETEIIAADGKVLASFGTEVTPELILKLYFQEIYAEEQKIEEQIVEIVEEIEDIKSSVDEEESTVVMKEFETDSVSGIRGTVATSAIVVDIASIGKGETDSELNDAVIDSETRVDDESSAQENTLATELDFEKTIEGTSSKGSSKKAKADKSSNVIESPVEKPEDKQLKFDEELAKRLVDNSVKVGKFLGFTQSELKELEQVAYNYNIGITQFTTDDLQRNGFRKIKVRASYEQLLKTNTVSEKIIESIKCCTSNYESETFSLNSKIPYHHVVGVTSYYEELLAQYNSKSKTLAKMMELGGNKFNIFVLHKFIRIMREENE